MPKKCILFPMIGLFVVFSIMLIPGFIGVKGSLSETVSGGKSDRAVKQQPTTGIGTQEWETIRAEPDLVRVVNFLIKNKGKEMELAGKKHKITGKEEIDVEVKVRGCTKLCFKKGVEAVSAYGKIKHSSFEDTAVYALVPAESIPQMQASSFLIFRIYLTPEAKDHWMQLLK